MLRGIADPRDAVCAVAKLACGCGCPGVKNEKKEGGNLQSHKKTHTLKRLEKPAEHGLHVKAESIFVWARRGQLKALTDSAGGNERGIHAFCDAIGFWLGFVRKTALKLKTGHQKQATEF